MASVTSKLSGGDRKSIGRASEVAERILASPKLLPELLDGFRQPDPVVRARSSVALKKIALKRPEFMQQYKRFLFEEMSTIDQWEVKENFCIILPVLKLDDREISAAIEILQEYLDYYSSIVKTCAMQALTDLAIMKPELKSDVQPVIEQLTREGTAAMRARGKRLLKTLQKI